MKRWLENVFYQISRRMQGCYGHDALGTLFIVGIALIAVFRIFVRFWPLSLLSTILLIWYCLRFFSRNLLARKRELQHYLRLQGKVQAKVSLLQQRWQQRNTHCYFRCKRCGITLRVPKGKGKIRVSCPKCGEAMIKKT